MRGRWRRVSSNIGGSLKNRSMRRQKLRSLGKARLMPLIAYLLKKSFEHKKRKNRLKKPSLE